MQQMLDEKADFQFPDVCAPGKDCNRYTQMIWSETTRVGCGTAVCGADAFWACSYAVGGNIRGGEGLRVGLPPLTPSSTIAGSAKCSNARGSQRPPADQTVPDVPLESQTIDTCDERYLIPSNVVSDSPSLSTAKINDILLLHNKARRNVVPYAKEMPMLHWSSELANASHEYAASCPTGPSAAADRPLYNGRVVGQSVASGANLTVDEALQQFLSEKAGWTYPFNCAGADCSRYMQVIWAETTRVGCAYSVCGTSVHFVCSYALGANVAPSYNTSRSYVPYEYASLEDSARCTADRGTATIDDSCDEMYLLPADALPPTPFRLTPLLPAKLQTAFSEPRTAPAEV